METHQSIYTINWQQCSLDTEDDFLSVCRNASCQDSSFQNYPNIDDHTKQTTSYRTLMKYNE